MLKVAALGASASVLGANPWQGAQAATPADTLRSLLRPGPDAEWRRYRVDPIVGQARIDEARCIDALPEQPTLF